MRACLLAASLSVHALACGSKGDGEASTIPLPASKPVASTPSPVATGPITYGSCDVVAADDHDCLEFRDPEIADEWKTQCKGTFSDRPCGRNDIIGSCRYPDGTLRIGYPPRPNTFYERACKDAQGQYLAGAMLPEDHAVTLVSCIGKYDEGCEEEEIHSPTRLATAEDECTSFKGTWTKGKSCPRESLVGECDLPGKRRILMTGPANPDARARFCTQKRGRLVGGPSPAPSAGASVEPDADPPPERGEIEIRPR